MDRVYPLMCFSRGFTADATKSCALQNLQTRNYLAVSPDEQRTTFIEPDNFSDKAEIAGIQRLLKDNGFKISRIDGISGRRTLRYIRDFKKKSGLPVSTSNRELIDICLLYTSPSPRDATLSRMPSSA